jgi:hypothetical protein
LFRFRKTVAPALLGKAPSLRQNSAASQLRARRRCSSTRPRCFSSFSRRRSSASARRSSAACRRWSSRS